MKPESPFKVPPFEANWQKPEVQYFWWSWHPNYPNWAKSCWGGKTTVEAGAACGQLAIINEYVD